MVSRPIRAEAKVQAMSWGQLAMSMLEEVIRVCPDLSVHDNCFRELRMWPLEMSGMHERDGHIHCAERMLEQLLEQPGVQVRRDHGSYGPKQESIRKA